MFFELREVGYFVEGVSIEMILHHGYLQRVPPKVVILIKHNDFNTQITILIQTIFINAKILIGKQNKPK